MGGEWKVVEGRGSRTCARKWLKASGVKPAALASCTALTWKGMDANGRSMEGHGS